MRLGWLGVLVLDVDCPAGQTRQADRSCVVTAATVSGLAGTYSATVDTELSVGFAYEPAAAVVSVSSVAPAGLAFTVDDGDLRADLEGTPSLAGGYRVTLAFTQPGRVDEFSFAVTAQCPAGAASCTAAGGPRAAPLPRCPHPRPGTTGWT